MEEVEVRQAQAADLARDASQNRWRGRTSARRPAPAPRSAPGPSTRPPATARSRASSRPAGWPCGTIFTGFTVASPRSMHHEKNRRQQVECVTLRLRRELGRRQLINPVHHDRQRDGIQGHATRTWGPGGGRCATGRRCAFRLVSAVLNRSEQRADHLRCAHHRERVFAGRQVALDPRELLPRLRHRDRRPSVDASAGRACRPAVPPDHRTGRRTSGRVLRPRFTMLPSIASPAEISIESLTPRFSRRTVQGRYGSEAPSRRLTKNRSISAGWTGLEPAASGVTGRRYNQA